MTIFLRVREIAEAQGISQRQLFFRSQVDLKTIQKVYRHPTSAVVNTDTLDKLAQALNIDVSMLIVSIPTQPLAFVVEEQLCFYCEKRTEPGDTEQLCSTCRNPINVRETRRLKMHLREARQNNNVASLTLKQWLASLDYFQWRCAYCLEPYVSLDHFVPSCLGGETSKSNCVPSCSACNTNKSKKHPNKLKNFSVDRLNYIRAYLDRSND